MITKKINDTISNASILLHLAIIVYMAVWLSNGLWEVFFSSGHDLYVQRYTADQFEKSAKYVASRNPFGQIIQPPAEATPSIVSQIKLTGVYVNTPDSSIAFIELDGQSSILKIGDQINNEATLTNITPNSIVISYNGSDFNVNLTGGSGSANTVQSSYIGRSNQVAPQEQNQMFNNLAQHMNVYNHQSPNEPNEAQNQNMLEQRSNLIKQFEEQKQQMLHNNGPEQTNNNQAYNNNNQPIEQAPNYPNNHQSNNETGYNQQR